MHDFLLVPFFLVVPVTMRSVLAELLLIARLTNTNAPTSILQLSAEAQAHSLLPLQRALMEQ